MLESFLQPEKSIEPKQKYTIKALFEESYKITVKELEKIKGRSLTEKEKEEADKLARMNVRMALRDMKII